MIICSKCGTQVPMKGRFCPNCGEATASLGGEESAGGSAKTPPTGQRSTRGRGTAIGILIGILALFGIMVYPVVLVVVALPALFVLVNVKGSRARIATSRFWRMFPTKRFSPIVAAVILLIYSATASGIGYAAYSSSNSSADQAHVTATALAQVHATRVVAARVAAHIAATARIRLLRSALAGARVKATARAVAAKRAAPKETVVAIQRAKAHARAHAAAAAHAYATAQIVRAVQAQGRVRQQATQQAQAQADAQNTQQAGIAAAAQQTQAATPSGDTYADVKDHPDAHQGDIVQWTCSVYKFLDSNTVGCWEYTGTFNGVAGDGAMILDVSNVDMSAVHSGDDVSVYGVVTQPRQVTNLYGASITNPQIIVKSFTDLGHDANASILP
jgi:pyruvate/2-oxoglutarate dehydrogenase complex dihydrolipoamide acyltransferase (E2) component